MRFDRAPGRVARQEPRPPEVASKILRRPRPVAVEWPSRSRGPIAMPVVVTCPACQRKARVPRKSVGKSIRCPSCGNNFTAVGDAGSSTQFPAALTDEPDVPPPTDSAADDGRRVTRYGVALLAAAQALLAAGTVLQLLLALVRLIATDSGGKSSFQESFTEFVMIAGTLALVGG